VAPVCIVVAASPHDVHAVWLNAAAKVSRSHFAHAVDAFAPSAVAYRPGLHGVHPSSAVDALAEE
jgi:hypothetical protein